MKKITVLALLLASPNLAFAQEVEPKPAPVPVIEGPKEELPEESKAQEEGEVPKVPILPEGFVEKPKDSTEEIVELFKKVNEKMKAIDDLLFDIGAGEAPLAAPQDSGLGDLLKLTKGASDDVVRDIDKILKIAEEMSKSQSQSKSKSQGQSGQPEKKQGEKAEGDGEKPEGGPPQKEEPQSGEEDKNGEDPSGEKDEQPKGEPKSGEESDEPGLNTPGSDSSDAQLGAGSKANRSERWGELPERLRETFRTQGGEDLPLFYRDWIESYYRHLNQGDSR